MRFQTEVENSEQPSFDLKLDGPIIVDDLTLSIFPCLLHHTSIRNIYKIIRNEMVVHRALPSSSSSFVSRFGHFYDVIITLCMFSFGPIALSKYFRFCGQWHIAVWHQKCHFAFGCDENNNNSPVAPVKRVLINSFLFVRFVSHDAHAYNLVPLIWSKNSRPILMF